MQCLMAKLHAMGNTNPQQYDPERVGQRRRPGGKNPSSDEKSRPDCHAGGKRTIGDRFQLNRNYLKLFFYTLYFLFAAECLTLCLENITIFPANARSIPAMVVEVIW